MLSPSAQKVQNVLAQANITAQVIELPSSTRTAQEAAQTLGCEVAHIVKSLLFKTVTDDRPILVLASGINRVNEKAIALHAGQITKADADFVREKTGFAIGGVPPVAHVQPIETYIDEDLLRYEKLWAAAGTPHAVFSLTPDQLIQLTQGKVISIK